MTWFAVTGFAFQLTDLKLEHNKKAEKCWIRQIANRFNTPSTFCRNSKLSDWAKCSSLGEKKKNPTMKFNQSWISIYSRYLNQDIPKIQKCQGFWMRLPQTTYTSNPTNQFQWTNTCSEVAENLALLLCIVLGCAWVSSFTWSLSEPHAS